MKEVFTMSPNTTDTLQLRMAIVEQSWEDIAGDEVEVFSNYRPEDVVNLTGITALDDADG
jgi:hypothetical protein